MDNIMIKLKVLTDDFMIGQRKEKKGAIIEVHPGAVAYCVNNGDCELHNKKPATRKKKATYKTKVMEAE